MKFLYNFNCRLLNIALICISKIILELYVFIYIFE